MKTLTLLFLIPLAVFSQEMPVAFQSGDVWHVSNEVKNQFQYGLDSLQHGEYTVDSVKYQNDSVLSLFFHDATYNYSDRMVVKLFGDTLKTTPDPMRNICYNTCFSIDCGGCLKSATCSCVCFSSGGCESVNLGVFEGATASDMIRERILISTGHSIPKD